MTDNLRRVSSGSRRPPALATDCRRCKKKARREAGPEGSELALESVAVDRVGGGARSRRLRLDLVRADVERTPLVRHVEEIERARIAVEIDAVDGRRHV